MNPISSFFQTLTGCMPSGSTKPSPAENLNEVQQFYNEIRQTACNSMGKLVLEAGITRCDSKGKPLSAKQLQRGWKDLAPLIHDLVLNDEAFKEAPAFLKDLAANENKPAKPLTSAEVIDLFSAVGLVHDHNRDHRDDTEDSHYSAYIKPEYNRITKKLEENITIVVIQPPTDTESRSPSTDSVFPISKDILQQFDSPTKLYDAIFKQSLKPLVPNFANSLPPLKPYDWDGNSLYTEVNYSPSWKST